MHAVLSPSGASRWLACTPSARLEQSFPDQAGEAAREGTLAHRLGELLIKYDQKLINGKNYQAQLMKIKTDPLYKNEMLAYCEDYATYVLETFSAAKAHTSDAVLILEQKVNLTEWVPDGFGTTDANIIADSTLDIVDLKYGKGVSVTAVENRQMMIYALGALREFDYLYDLQTVRMTIYQPRIQNISTWELSVEDLKKWAETELKPRAKMAFEGEGEFTPGSHCMFCRAKAVCKANAAYNLEIEEYDYRQSPLLSDDEIADILTRADRFKKWLKSVEENALQLAVQGKRWPGFKLVEGRSNRVYSDKSEVEKRLIAAGYSPEIIFKPKELLGITAMQGELGKKTFDLNLADLLIKPMGKPALVLAGDKRPELNTAELAERDFNDGFEDVDE
jgi:Protein of unknown function (DUF2800)